MATSSITSQVNITTRTEGETLIKALEEAVLLSDTKVDVLTYKSKGMDVYPRNQFVRIEHIPSGITVTKHSTSQIKARDEAMEELKMLVELWR